VSVGSEMVMEKSKVEVVVYVTVCKHSALMMMGVGDWYYVEAPVKVY
jgi:hypothetical protein